MADPIFTLLVLDPFGVPLYSARGLRQTLEPIAAASKVGRTVNGELLDLSAPQLRKYKSTITGDDQLSPALSGVWPGMEVTVDCITELAYQTAGGSPDRAVADTRTDGDWTYYRPQLVMRVTGYTLDTNEWGAQVGWRLDLEEV